MKLARGHSVSDPACVHLPHVPEISAAIGVVLLCGITNSSVIATPLMSHYS